MLRYNNINNKFEGFTNEWKELGSDTGSGGNTTDIDNDTKIILDENEDNDIINFYTENVKRMIISNSTKSGFIGIGNNFNNPNATLDINGNLIVSQEVNLYDNLYVDKSLEIQDISIFNNGIVVSLGL